MKKSRKCRYGKRKSDGRCKRKPGPKSKSKKSRKCRYGKRKSDGRCKRKSGPKSKKVYRYKSRTKSKRNKSRRLKFSIIDSTRTVDGLYCGNLLIVSPLNAPLYSIEGTQLLLKNTTSTFHDTRKNREAVPETLLGTSYMTPAIWTINENDINGFSSHLDASLTPMDCTISAMQYIGILSLREANITRMTCISNEGASDCDIARILTYTSYYTEDLMEVDGQTKYFLYNFQYYTDWKIWLDTCFNILKYAYLVNGGKPQILFVGYIGHVFNVAFDLLGLWVIEPQAKEKKALLMSAEAVYDQENVKKFVIRKNMRPYRICVRSVNKILVGEMDILTLMGFDFTMGRGTANNTAGI